MSQFDRIEQSQIEKIAKKIVAQSGGGGGGVTDHGALTGLGDDDHTQYHNDTRGDARYSQLAHTHALSALTVSGALANQVPAWSGSAWVPVTPAAAVSDGDKGDITVSSSGTVWNIDAATVGLTELSATGTPTSANFLRGDNAWSTGVLVTDGDKGDITVSSSGTVWDIDAGAVTTTELGGDITTAGKALLDDANAAAQRTTLGLGALATLADAPALTLTGTVLNPAIVTSSLTSVGTLAALTVTAPIAGSVTGNAATVTTNANLTGHITSTGNATLLGAFTSLQLKTALSDETGAGAAVFADTPTLVTPLLGTPTSGNLSNCTNLPSHNHAGTDITTGIVDPLRLGSGASGTTFLRGDSTWQTIAGGGTVTSVATGTGLSGGPITGTGTIIAVYGSAVDTICQGNDARLSDARTPTAHNHAGADITTGTVSALRLGSNVPDSGKYLRGDGTWQPHIVELAEDAVTSFHIADGTIGLIELSAGGTASSTTFLRGDNTWAVPAGGSGISFQDSLRMGTIL